MAHGRRIRNRHHAISDEELYAGSDEPNNRNQQSQPPTKSTDNRWYQAVYLQLEKEILAITNVKIRTTRRVLRRSKPSVRAPAVTRVLIVTVAACYSL
jgi:hypothetical protein